MTSRFKAFIFVFIGGLCLMIDALYNGFPIVYSDTSTYLASGFQLETPFDRPITYGLFLRFFSLNGYSLWLVVFFQALILSYMIFSVFKLFLHDKQYLLRGLIAIIFLSLFTGVSWTTSQIMPDIFTPIALLCMILILLANFSALKLVAFYVLFFISVAMHMSHILMFSFLLIIIFFFSKYIFKRPDYKDTKFKISILFALTMLSIFTMGSAISKSKHVFLMGAMVEHGILKRFLHENCNNHQYKLCQYKDSLPGKAYQFIWDPKSPFYKVGGWKETKSEFNEIILKTIITPDYLSIHLKESLKATLDQLCKFAIGDGNGAFLNGTVLFQRIMKYFPAELPDYIYSRQNQTALSFITKINLLFTVIILLSLLILLSLTIKFFKTVNHNIKSFMILVFLGLIINAWDCGTFANAIDRLGCKMIWLLPFICLLFLPRLNLFSKFNTTLKPFLS